MSNEEELLSRAGVVFEPWLNDETAVPICRLVVEKSSGRWWLRVDNETHLLSCDTVEEMVIEVEYEAVCRLMDTCRYLSFHAALLCRDGRGLMIVGRPTAGKSTLSCGLWRSGWSFLGDDTTLCDPARALGFPVPRRVALRYGSRGLVGEGLWSRIVSAPSAGKCEKGYFFHPSDIDGCRPPRDTKLHAVIFLARRSVATAAATLRRIDAGNALLSLLPYTNYVEHRDPGETLHAVQPLADSVACYDLGRGTLPEMIKQIDRLFAY